MGNAQNPRLTSRSGPVPRAVGRGGRTLLAAIGVALTLAACGGTTDETNPGAPAPTEAVSSNAEFSEGASPEVVTEPETTDRPAEVNELSATISEGRLEPDPLEGTAGQSYVLTITGDGTAHTLVITDLVTETEIVAEGETEVDFSISGDAGDREILLDDAPAGTFRVLSASGTSD